MGIDSAFMRPRPSCAVDGVLSAVGDGSAYAPFSFASLGRAPSVVVVTAAAAAAATAPDVGAVVDLSMPADPLHLHDASQRRPIDAMYDTERWLALSQGLFGCYGHWLPVPLPPFRHGMFRAMHLGGGADGRQQRQRRAHDHGGALDVPLGYCDAFDDGGAAARRAAARLDQTTAASHGTEDVTRREGLLHGTQCVVRGLLRATLPPRPAPAPAPAPVPSP